MKDAWFHKRGPGEGTGYGVKNAKGMIATLVFVFLIVGVVMGAVYAPQVLHTQPFASMVVAMGIGFVLLVAFLALVIARSDAR